MQRSRFWLAGIALFCMTADASFAFQRKRVEPPPPRAPVYHWDSWPPEGEPRAPGWCGYDGSVCIDDCYNGAFQNPCYLFSTEVKEPYLCGNGPAIEPPSHDCICKYTVVQSDRCLYEHYLEHLDDR